MTLESIALAIRNMSLFSAVRESALFYPAVLSTHLTCIALFGGMILTTNLRLLGWAFQNIAPSELIRVLRPWKAFGLILMVTCGVLMAGAKADAYLPNAYFRLKLILLGSLVVHSLAFRQVYHDPALIDAPGGPPARAKLAAGLSLLLWTAVVCAGRWIAYWDSPKAIF